MSVDTDRLREAISRLSWLAADPRQSGDVTARPRRDDLLAVVRDVPRLIERAERAEAERDLYAEALRDDREKWSFGTCMYVAQRLLDEHYGPSVFVGGPDADPGVRLVVALRDCIAALAGEEQT